jgi:hypothetical protein
MPRAVPRISSNTARSAFKLARVRISDPCAPGFQEEVERQANLLQAAPEESEALDFIASATQDEPQV